MANRYDQFSYDPPTAKNVVVDLLNGQMSSELDEEDVPIGHDHDPSLPGRGGPIKAASITNVPAGNITSTNMQAAITELDGLAALGRTHVPVRQTVLHGYTNGVGQAAFLQQGSGLSVNLLAASTPVIIAFAYNFNPMFGQLDFIGSVTEDIPSAWFALPPNQTCYLYVDRDIDTGVLTYSYSLLAPVYEKLPPGTPVTDQHWFDLNSFYMKRYSGTEWENKQRVFVGECTTNADSVTSVVCYAIQGKYESDIFAITADSTILKNHNIGVMPRETKLRLANSSNLNFFLEIDRFLDAGNNLAGVSIDGLSRLHCPVSVANLANTAYVQSAMTVHDHTGTAIGVVNRAQVILSRGF